MTNSNISFNKSTEVESCLTRDYRLDEKTTALIKTSLTPFIDDEKYHSLIDAFIENSKNLKIGLLNNPSLELSPDDGVLKAPQFHNILFENSHVRILRGVVNPGERVPFHLHQWKCLMIVVQGTEFKTEHSDGSIEIEDCPIGFYKSEGEKATSAYTNIGNTPFEALLFEVKD